MSEEKQIVRAGLRSPPFAVQAVVLEEDTGLVLSADNTIRNFEEHPVRLMSDLISYEFPSAGTLVIQEGSPHYLLAVVNDLEQVPHCQKDWVIACLSACFAFCGEKGITALATQILGSVYGNLDPDWFEVELRIQLAASQVQRVWIMDRD